MERRIRSFETANGAESNRCARPSAFSVAHRICSSRRLSSDCASPATARPVALSRRTTSITPRAGVDTGTSTSADHRPSRDLNSVSIMGAWNLSCSRGPEPGNQRTPRSAPNATPIAVRTSTLAEARPDSIRARYVRWMPTTSASVVSDTPASRRKRRACSPVARTWRLMRRSVSRATAVRLIVMQAWDQIALIWRSRSNGVRSQRATRDRRTKVSPSEAGCATIGG